MAIVPDPPLPSASPPRGGEWDECWHLPPKGEEWEECWHVSWRGRVERGSQSHPHCGILSPPATRGEMSRSDRGGREEGGGKRMWANPPLPSASPPRGGSGGWWAEANVGEPSSAFGISPQRGVGRLVGGSECGSDPPLPTASPPRGGRKGMQSGFPQRRGVDASLPLIGDLLSPYSEVSSPRVARSPLPHVTGFPLPPLGGDVT